MLAAMILSWPEDDKQASGLNRLDKIENILHMHRYFLSANI
jgi:hypothetical protein